MDGLENNTKRYAKIMSEAADAAMPQPSRLDYEKDTFDILSEQVLTPECCRSDCSQVESL